MVKVTDIQVILLSQCSLYYPEVLGQGLRRYGVKLHAWCLRRILTKSKNAGTALTIHQGMNGSSSQLKGHWGGQLTEICMLDQAMD